MQHFDDPRRALAPWRPRTGARLRALVCPSLMGLAAAGVAGASPAALTSVLGSGPGSEPAVGIALPAVASPVVPAQEGAAERQSLESLLERVERERARRVGELRPKVAALMAELDDTPGRRPTATTDAKKRALLALGSEALPLIVPYIDPGPEEGTGPAIRSLIASEVLAESPTPAVTDGLAGVALTGTMLGRMRALFALRTTPEPDRALPAVIAVALGKGLKRLKPKMGDLQVVAEGESVEDMLERMRKIRDGEAEDTGETSGDKKPDKSIDTDVLRQEAYVTIAQYPCEAAQSFLRDELLGSDEDRRSMALRALGSAPADAGGALILELLSGPDAAGFAGAIASFYGTNDRFLSESSHAEAVATVARADGVQSDARIALFGLLRLTDAKLTSTAKRDIERRFSEASHPDVRRSALLLLARNKDRGAKRELLDGYDERLTRGRNRSLIYAERARLYHDIGDWSAASKDWRTAMKEEKTQGGTRRLTGAFVGLARSLARLKKYRDAEDYLKRSPLSLSDLQKLADDRDFIEMAKSRYRSAFHLD